MIDFPFKLAVGEAVQANLYGSNVKYVVGSAGGADPSIKVKTDGGDEYVLLPGQGFSFKNKVFTKLNISNAGGVAPIIGRLILADSDFIDNRTSGQVEVIDGGKNRTMAGSAMMGFCYAPAVGGQLAHAGLMNQAAGGKNLFIETIYSSTNGVFSSMLMSLNAAVLNTLSGNGKAKRGGGANSVAELRNQNSVAAVAGGTTLMLLDPIQRSIKFTEPVMIPPGYGIFLMHQTVGADCSAVFEYFEESV